MAIRNLIFVVFAQIVITIFFFIGEAMSHDEKSHSAGLSPQTAGIILIVCLVIISVLVVFDVYFMISTKRLHARYNTPDKELMKLLDDKPNVIDSKSLYAQTRQILALVPGEKHGDAWNPHDQARIDVLVKSITDESQTQPTEIVPGSRDKGTLPIRKDNRVKLAGRPTTTLHISRMVDLYGNPMFLSAAPLPDQFADHWEAIWQNEIGIVIWVGRLNTIFYEQRMDAYIGLRQGQEVSYGNFRIKTVESGDLVYKFALYYIRVFRGKEKRDMMLLHAYEWLQESVSWAMERDVEMINVIKEEHMRTMKMHGLRGILFQCKFGTAGSATMLAVYIGFQFWMRAERVNMRGILRYIRRMRAMAFELTGDPAHTVIGQVKVAHAVMYAVAKFCEKKKTTRYEKWIKDLLAESRAAVTTEISARL